MIVKGYRVQVLTREDGNWNDVESFSEGHIAIMTAREINQKCAAGDAVHRVINPEGKELYRRGWLSNER